MPQINVTIQAEIIGQLKELFGSSNNENGRKAIEGFLALYFAWEANARKTGKIFTWPELSYLVDIQNGTILTSPIQASHRAWIAEIEDSDELDRMGEKWEVDVPGLIEKVKELSQFDVFFWRLAIDRFWQVEGAYGSPTPDLEKFLNDYAIS